MVYFGSRCLSTAGEALYGRVCTPSVWLNQQYGKTHSLYDGGSDVDVDGGSDADVDDDCEYLLTIASDLNALYKTMYSK